MFVNRREFIKITLGMLASIELVGCDLSPPPELDQKKILLVYWIVSILQPIDVRSVIGFFIILEDYVWQTVSEREVQRSIKFLIEEGYILDLLIGTKHFFSISPEKSFKLSSNERLSRDRLRFFLLSSINLGSVSDLKEGCKLLVDGDPPSPEERLPIQLRIGVNGRQSQPPTSSWVSLTESTSFASPPFLSLLSPFHYSFSYPGENFIAKIGNELPEHTLVRHILAYDLGFSPQLITRILANKSHYYRVFKVPKKSGGSREVSSPRTFLKVILRYIKSYLLAGLEIHDSVHSYRKGRSFLTNAQEHVGKRYVLNIDLESYFSNITKSKVRTVLRRNGFSRYGSILLASLCTLEDVLPQGAPTSPLISNSIFFRIDSAMHKYCKKHKLSYTRYSDDMTISGDSKLAIEKARVRLTVMVKAAKFKINDNKTRLMPYHKRQLVTGVVVNHVPTPPRDVMRKIRAKFHEASKGEVVEEETQNHLLGYISYLSVFDKYKGSDLLENYKSIINNVRIIKT